MNYESTIRVESKTCPGVVYTLHKPSYGRVLEFDVKNAGFREKARKMNKESRELTEELQAYRKAWFEAQAAKLAEMKAKEESPKSIEKIEAGLEYERLLELAQRAETKEQSNDVAETLLQLPAEKEVFEIEPELLERIRQARENSDALVAGEYNAPRMRWGLASVEELTINGKPATADNLIADGPPDLVREIVAKIDEITSMTQEQLKNFGQPSSSEEVAGKAVSITTAIAA